MGPLTVQPVSAVLHPVLQQRRVPMAQSKDDQQKNQEAPLDFYISSEEE